MPQWDLTPAEAIALQKRLSSFVTRKSKVKRVATVAGIDTGYNQGTSRAAVVKLEYPSLKPIASAVAERPVRFPYIPGLLSFREGPVIIEAFEKLNTLPDLLIFDGQGIAHPRRFGIACHIGLMLDIPSIQTACTTSQDKPNEKAEDEAISGYALMKKYGFHQMRHSFGFLNELISFSIAKLERHIDLCRDTDPDRAPEYYIEPYDTEGLEAIIRNGSQANYMRDDHTVKNTGQAFLQ